MKQIRFFINISLVAIVFCIGGCIRYAVVPDCELEAKFIVNQDTVVAGPDGKALVTFIDSSSVFSGMEYEWDFRDGSSIDSKRNPPHSFSPGVFRVLLTVRLGEGCVDTFSRLLTVLDGGPVAAFSTDKAGDMCFVSETVTFTNSSTNGVRYDWNFGDDSPIQSISNSNPISHSYSKAGTYTVTLTAFDSGGRSHQTSRELVVKVPVFEPFKFTVGSNPVLNPEAIYGIDEGGNGQIYVAINNMLGCYLLKVEKGGQIINGSPALQNLGGSFSTISLNNTMKKLSNGYLLVGEVYTTSSGIGSIYLLKANLSFDSPVNKSVHDQAAGGAEYGFSVTDKNGDFLVCGYAERPTSGGMYFAHVNSSTLLLQASSSAALFTSDNTARALAIIPLPGGGYLVAGKKKNTSNAEACFFQLTESLTLSGSVHSWNATTFTINDIIPLANDKYALVGKDNEILRIRVIDLANNLSWDKTFSGYNYGQVIYTSDGRLVAVGSATDASVKKVAWLEIDPANGDKLNDELHTVDGLLNVSGSCIAATADGGFLIGANGVDASGHQWNAVIKTDQNGKNN